MIGYHDDCGGFFRILGWCAILAFAVTALMALIHVGVTWFRAVGSAAGLS